jgi:uncharacterized membrane protein
LLWFVVHLLPSAAPALRQKLVGGMGENTYKGVAAVLLLCALALIVFGWRGSVASHLYALPGFTRHLGMLLVLIAFIVFGTTSYPSRIKQYVRHPQLTGVSIWALAHLMMNLDTRSIVLFSSMLVWAILSIVLINRRDGEWVKPSIPGWATEIKGLIISLVVFVVVVVIHPYITGMPIF